jgi:hypothetical protein
MGAFAGRERGSSRCSRRSRRTMLRPTPCRRGLRRGGRRQASSRVCVRAAGCAISTPCRQRRGAAEGARRPAPCGARRRRSRPAACGSSPAGDGARTRPTTEICPGRIAAGSKLAGDELAQLWRLPAPIDEAAQPSRWALAAACARPRASPPRARVALPDPRATHCIAVRFCKCLAAMDQAVVRLRSSVLRPKATRHM